MTYGAYLSASFPIPEFPPEADVLLLPDAGGTHYPPIAYEAVHDEVFAVLRFPLEETI
jgi:hypothetical protein